MTEASSPELKVCYREPDIFTRLAGVPPSLRCTAAPLEAFDVAEHDLKLGDSLVPTGSIESAELRFHGSDPIEASKPEPGERGNRWGYNVTLAGPSGLLGLAFDARPVRWIGFELGVVPLVGAAGGFGGIRAAPIRPSGFYPFVGAYAAFWIVGEGEHQDSSSLGTCVGPRAGVGIDIKKDVELRGEFDLCRTGGEGPTGNAREHRWMPWGGAAIASYW